MFIYRIYKLESHLDIVLDTGSDFGWPKSKRERVIPTTAVIIKSFVQSIYAEIQSLLQRVSQNF